MTIQPRHLTWWERIVIAIGVFVYAGYVLGIIGGRYTP